MTSFSAVGKNDIALAMLRVPGSVLGYMEIGAASKLTDFLGEAKIGNAGYPESFVGSSEQSLQPANVV